MYYCNYDTPLELLLPVTGDAVSIVFPGRVNNARSADNESRHFPLT